ncbi:MAG: hypothetical protein K2X87_10585, partial [Gemmataceae bacterium]|nr:hypothetical protein [Gemmataceae bacterium]
AGRGPVFWVLAVLAVVTLLVVATCGGVFALLQPRWRPHQSDAGGFRVELPAEPRADMPEVAPVNARPDARTEGTILLVKLEVYAVTYADLAPEDRRPAADDLLDQAVKGIEGGTPGTQVLRTAAVKAGGFPAREVVVAGPDGTFHCRVVLAGPRVYVVAAGGALTTPEGNERIRRFLDSFAVTDPELLAGRGADRANPRPAPVPDPVRQPKAGREPAARPPEPEPEPDEPAPKPRIALPVRPWVAPPPRPAQPPPSRDPF